MAGEDSSALISLVQRAVVLSDEERSAFLDEVCKDDVSLRKRIEAVLVTIDDPGTAVNNTPPLWGLPAEGNRIGKYTILEKLGGGGMGIVYRAEDSRLKRHVALKFLAAELTRDADARERFILEAQAASTLDHSNICTVYEVDETPQGLMYISMACYDGKTLKQRIKEGPLPVEIATDFAIQIGKGLARAHAKGIVHRDIKPANIMVVQDGDSEVIKILDFGLAKITEVNITRAGSTLGTVAYMSPEQARGDAVDHRTDIWSLGVVFYEMLTGRRPYSGAFEQAIIYSLLYEPHRPIHQLLPELPHELEHVFSRVLEKDADKRYQSIDELLNDLGSPQSVSVAQEAVKPVKKQSFKWPAIPQQFIVAGLIILAIIAGILYLPIKTPSESTRQLIMPADLRQLTFTGASYFPAISPDGQLMAYYAQDSDSIGSIYVQELNGGQPLKVLSEITSYSPDLTRIRWSPDGKLLAAYVGVQGAENKLHIVPRLGGEARSFLAGVFFMWSPDASQIVHVHEAGEELIYTDVRSLRSTVVPLNINEAFVRGIDWAPDGDQLALITMPANYETHTIWTLSPDGTEQKSVLVDTVSLFAPRWSNDGSSVYYLRGSNGEFDLWKTDVSTASQNTPRIIQRGVMQDHKINKGRITLSADRNRLLYSQISIERNLWVYQRAGEGDRFVEAPQMVTDGTAIITYTTFSPDGEHLAFVMQNASGSDVYTMPSGGGVIQQRTFMQGEINGLSWSPDGQRFTFGVLEDEENRIWVADLSSGLMDRFDDLLLSRSGILTWQPGIDILYHLPGNRNFSLLNVESGEEHPLVSNDSVGWMFNASYSPDGQTVAAYWNRSDARGLWLFSLVDGSQEQLVKFLDTSGAYYPLKWSSDGQWIYATNPTSSTQQIVQISVDNGEIQELMTLPQNNNWGIDISPDDRQLVVTLSEIKSDVWLMENFDADVVLEK